MKISSKSRSFARQVQQDLLALSEVDLLHTVHQWMEVSHSSELPLAVSEETRSALGYTCVPPEIQTVPDLLSALPSIDSEGIRQWLAPSAHSLRTLIMAMDVNLFAQHVIPLAFQALHTTYPEWDEGMIFDAHLANYLREMKRRTIPKAPS